MEEEHEQRTSISAPAAPAPTTGGRKTRGGKSSGQITISNKSKFSLVCIFTKANVPLGDDFVEDSVVYSVNLEDSPSFTFDSDMYLTLIRKASDGSGYRMLKSNNLLKLGSILELNFDDVVNPSSDTVPLNYLDRFIKKNSSTVAPPTPPPASAIGASTENHFRVDEPIKSITPCLSTPSSQFVTPVKQPLEQGTPPPGLNAAERKAWYTANSDYHCHRCGKPYKYSQSTGKRYQFRENGTPSKYMINCECW